MLEFQQRFIEKLIKTWKVTECMTLLNTLFNSFKEQQVVSFATVEGKQPRVRPMSLIYFDQRFFMITGARGGKKAKKLIQIRKTPRYEYYLTLKGEKVDGFIRGMGDALEVSDFHTRKKIYDEIAWASNYFDSVDNPDYVLLELKHDGFSYRKPDEVEIHYITLDELR